MAPFIKWPGGKRWLAPRLIEAVETELSGRYIEPFLGGGAMFFKLHPKRAVLSDVNPDLIELYRCVRDEPDRLLAKVWRFSNTAECFYRVRASRPRTTLGRAARMLYLSRTSFGGIYRLNRNGEFNAPFGNSGRVVCRRETVLAASAALKESELFCADFEARMNLAQQGDVIYADPPFAAGSECAGFRRYNGRLFTWSDQERLARAAGSAAARGALVVLSASWHPQVLELYRGFWAIRVERSSRVSRAVRGRGMVGEAVLLSRRPSSAALRGARRIGEDYELSSIAESSGAQAREFDCIGEAARLLQSVNVAAQQ